MVTGGSDTHLMVLNTRGVFGLTGKESEALLEKIGILVNRQVVPNEQLKPYVASGIRLGTSWITARGYSEDESRLIAKIILANLQDPTNEQLQFNSKKLLDQLLEVKRENDVWHDEEITQ
jgi:glycine hydroxymethyltransferase